MKICLFSLPSGKRAQSHIQNELRLNKCWDCSTLAHRKQSKSTCEYIARKLFESIRSIRALYPPSETNKKNQVIVHSSWTYWLPNFCSNIFMLFLSFLLVPFAICNGKKRAAWKRIFVNCHNIWSEHCTDKMDKMLKVHHKWNSFW